MQWLEEFMSKLSFCLNIYKMTMLLVATTPSVVTEGREWKKWFFYKSLISYCEIQVEKSSQSL